MSTWRCLDPTCSESGHLTHIGVNGGADVRHMTATTHGVTAGDSDVWAEVDE